MSLATRCTSCGTVFRVVEDQLKISDGWVRCGQCSEVFNALEALFDIDRDAIATAATGTAPLPSSSPAPTPAPTPAPAPVPSSTTGPDTPAIASHRPEHQRLVSDAAVASAQPTTGRANPTISLADDGIGDALGADSGLPFDAVQFSDTDMLLSDEEIAALTLADAVSLHAGDVPIASPRTESASRAAVVAPVEPDKTRDVESAKTTRAAKAASADAPARDVDIDIDAPSPIEVLRPSKTSSRKSSSASSRRRPDFSDARFDSQSAESGPDIDAEIAAAMDSPTMRGRTRRPEFLRRAERAERWKSRPAKVGVALLSVVAGVALGAQVTHHFRDEAAADWPALRPALQAWCGVARCTLEAPRAIDDIAVDSTTLTQGASADAFKLAVMLRSRGRVALKMPSVSLSLTDLNGKLISRKVLSPADFHVPTVIAPGAEAALKATLSSRNARVTGYTVETFYP